MKNLFKIVNIFIFSFLIFSCAEKPEEVILQPDVKASSSAINVSIAKMDNAKYLNVFRAEWDEVNKKIDETKIFNIAQVTPKDDVLTSYVFIDEFLVKDKKYVYKIRYWNGTNYNVTSWSDPLGVSNSNFSTDEDLKYTIPDGVYYKYDSITSSITLTGFSSESGEIADISNFTDFKPALVFSYGEKDDEVRKIFTSEDKIELKQGSTINLRSLLTSDFFDRDIKLKYLVAQSTKSNEKSETSSSTKKVYYTEYVWSYPVEILLKDVNGDTLESIKISNSTAEEGGDYSTTGIDSGNNSTVNSSLRVLDY